MLIKYTYEQIISLNANDLWKNCIIIEKKNNYKDIIYELHPTGDADLNGRKYIALPVGTNINDPIIRIKYNLI